MSKELAIDDAKHGDEFRTGYSTDPVRVVYVKPGQPTPEFTRNDLVVFVPEAVIEGRAEREQMALPAPEVQPDQPERVLREWRTEPKHKKRPKPQQIDAPLDSTHKL